MAIVIADDDEQVRTSLRKLLERAGLAVVGEASNGGEALAMVEVLRPQVVLMDGKMPLMNGLVATRYLQSLHPEVKVIAHTSDPSMAEQMMALGAIAWVMEGLDRGLVGGRLASVRPKRLSDALNHGWRVLGPRLIEKSQQVSCSHRTTDYPGGRDTVNP